MNVCRLGFAFQCTLKHFLCSYIFTAVQLDYTAVVKRISVTRQNAFRAQPGVSYCQIGARACRNFRHLKIFFQQGAKLTASILRELERRNGRYGMVTMCVGGGMGAAGILERL